MKNIPKYFYWILTSLIISLTYSIVRYNLIKGVPWEDLPLYVLNKALALACVILFTIYRIVKIKGEGKSYKELNEFGVILAIFHVIISIIILSPTYFGKFYFESKLNLIGNLSMLFGVIAFMLMFTFSSKYLLRKTLNNKRVMLFVKNFFILTLILHVFIMGLNGWLNPNTWPGGLPPITLISFLVLISPYFIKRKTQSHLNN